MARVFNEFLSFFVYGFFLALEFLIVFGMLLAVITVPYAIAIYQLGAMPGSTETAWALFIGVLLMGVWFIFLIRGGRKKLRDTFEQLTRLTLNKLGIK